MNYPRFHYEDCYKDFDDYISSFPHQEFFYKQNEYFFHDFSSSANVKFYYYIKSGQAAVYGVAGENDDRKIICFYGDYMFPIADTNDFFFDIFAAIYIQALEDCVVYIYDYATFLELLFSNHNLAVQYLNNTNEFASNLIYQTTALALLTAECRLCDYLYMQYVISSKNQRQTKNIIYNSQAQLAQMIGVTRTQVTRDIRNLKSEGILTTRRGSVELLDIERLRSKCSHMCQY